MIGQVWVNKLAGTVFALASNTAGVATWLSLGGSFSPSVANVTVTNTATALHFQTSTAATATDLTANIWSAIGTNAAISLVLTPKGVGGVTVTSGALTLTAGALDLTLGSANLTNGDVNLTSGDVNLTAGDVNVTLGDVNLTAGDVDLTLGDVNLTNGNVTLNTAGNGLQVKEGANARMGQATLVAGTKSIANTSVTANTRIFVTRADINASVALGQISAGAINPGATFDINALDPANPAAVIAADVSIVNWLLVEAL
jgi:hypothetical protein